MLNQPDTSNGNINYDGLSDYNQLEPAARTPSDPALQKPASTAAAALEQFRREQRLANLNTQLQAVNKERLSYLQHAQSLEQERQQLQDYVNRLEQDRQNLLGYTSRLEQTVRVVQSTLPARALQRVDATLNRVKRLPGLLNSLRGTLDRPAADSQLVDELLEVTGWAFSNAAAIAGVEVYLEGRLLGPAQYGLERHDVIAARPWQRQVRCGFTATFNLRDEKLAAGPKKLSIKVKDTRGARLELERTIWLARPLTRPEPASVILNLPPAPLSYQEWIAQNEPSPVELDFQREQSNRLAYRPLISVITPVYNPTPAVLQAAIESVLGQTYPEWELCLVDGASSDSAVHRLLQEFSEQDKRIKVKFLDHNLGIAGNSNAALALAQGEFCALLDHDDVLSPDALYEVVEVLNEEHSAGQTANQSRPAGDFIYSDHDLLSEDGLRRFGPLFKPGWSPEIMLSANYLTHLTVIRTALIRQAGNFMMGTEGAQDWDLFFRVLELGAAVKHIPKILYHWRESATSTATDIYNKPEAPAHQVQAIQAHLSRQGLPDARAFFDQSGFLRASWAIRGNPKVSIIVPTLNKLELISRCVRSVLDKTTYPDFELVIVDTGSTDPAVHEFYDRLGQEARVRLLHYKQPFNYSAVNNWAAAQTEGEALVFLNNDTEVIAPDWLEELLRWAQRPEIGPVGARLLKPDGTIQHAGVIVGLEGFAGHIFAGLPEVSNSLFGLTEWYRNYTAVTAACMMVRRAVFDELQGFDEDFILNGSDVDLCLRAGEAGYRVVYNPFAKLYHLESATHQGKATPPGDYLLSRQRYLPLLQAGDPFFNPNLSYACTIPTLHNLGEPAPLEKVDHYLTWLQDQNKSSVKPAEDRYSYDANIIASWLDFSPELLAQSRQVQMAHRENLEVNSITWFLPGFDHAFYGGIHTILRFAAYFQQKGVNNRFVIINPVSVRKVQLSIGQAFAELANSSVLVVNSLAEVESLEATDAAICTFWSTAYYMLRFNQTKRKFYFIQDYEPLFYPAGSISAQVQATLRFGFYGLTNTVTLQQLYQDYYGGQAAAFTPAVNTRLFHPGGRTAPSEKTPPYTLFFYGRPGHPRNGFELGAAALRLVKARLGAQVRIVTAGAAWNQAEHNLEGVLENLGLLTYEQTAGLYRECDVGFVMMFTRHPSYLPLEFMASGCLVVTNINPATRWLLQDNHNCLLSEVSATVLADTLVKGLTDRAVRQRITDNALKFVESRYADWNSQIEPVWEFMRSPKPALPEPAAETARVDGSEVLIQDD